MAQTEMPADPPTPTSPVMEILVKHFTGEPVVGVGLQFSDYDSTMETPEGTLLARLQAVAATLPAPEEVHTIPFRVRTTWVLAPETRQELNPEAARKTPADVMVESMAVSELLLSLPPAMVRSIGGDDGVPFTQLPPAAQTILSRMVLPPLAIQETVPTEWKNESGDTETGTALAERGRIEAAIPWESVRLRANLFINNAFVAVGEQNASYLNIRQESVSRQIQAAEDHGRYRVGDVDLEPLLEVPNTFKPSDLEGRRLTMPFGTAGPMTLKQALDQVTKVTRLRFYLSDAQKPIPVFVGAASVPYGDVLDGIRLGLASAWRRIGDGYVLAWDRRGLAALQVEYREQTAATTKAVRKRMMEIEQETRWLEVAENMAFAPSDPLALTDAQRDLLLDSMATKERAGLTFRDLTPAQQEAIRKVALKQTLHIWEPEFGERGLDRPVQEGDLQNVSLAGDLAVRISLSIPGHGWLELPGEWTGGGIPAHRLQQAKRKLLGQPVEEILPDEVRPLLDNPGPVSLPARSRGVVVPPLRKARLGLLAQEMKNRGMTVLFYPVLSGGHATLTTSAFPLNPTMEEGEGWSDAVRIMKPAGITVIGYISLLAWQPLGQNAHWLSRHREWIDVDPLGHTRLEWLRDHPTAAANPALAGLVPSNMVRPAEPAVAARLKSLLADVAALKDCPGIAFTDWASGQSMIMGMMGFGQLSPPPLGYAVPERWEAVRRTGTDPLDQPLYPDTFFPRDISGMVSGFRPPELPGDRSKLLVSMLAEAKRLRPDWKTYTLPNAASELMGPPEPEDTVKPDVRVASLFMMGGRGSVDGLLLPISEKNIFNMMMDMERMPDDQSPIVDKLRALPSISLLHLAATTERDLATMNPSLVLYDFRAGAELITPSMAWIAPPGGKPAPSPPGETLKGSDE